MSHPPGSAAARLLDALAFGHAVVAAAAAALVAASSRAMELRADPVVALLAASGTLAIYGLDRLRDLERDRPTAPRRAAFVERHRRAIAVVSALAAAVAVAAGILAGPRCIAVAAGVAALGLAHRRLERFALAKPVYLILAWTAVSVALPLAMDIAVLGFRRSERYAVWGVDGALLAGAVAAWTASAA